LIDGFIVGFLGIFLLGQYEKKLVREKAQLDESIEYASLIQKAMFSDKEVKHYFQDHFTYIKQRDTVGGDFYSIIPLNDDEVLILVIDGVGHGVSGAFIIVVFRRYVNGVVLCFHS
jgi:serine phosphatase RsbU (regulator of sigma subunit)